MPVFIKKSKVWCIQFIQLLALRNPDRAKFIVSSRLNTTGTYFGHFLAKGLEAEVFE
jgi:hypothetical protein